MASFISRIFSVFKAKENKPKDISITVNVMGTEFTVNSSNIHASKEDLADWRARRARKYRRYNRLIRHKKIWTVLDYAKSLEAIYDSNNFYDLDKALLDYREALARFDIPDFHPSKNEILCAFRFFDMQNYTGKCEHRLSEKEKQNISNWSSHTLNYINILEAVSKRFITYWDEVLGSYKRKSAYLNRLEYLINHLYQVKNRKGLSTIPRFEEYINKLQVYYIEMKSTSIRDSNPTSKETVET